LWYNDDNNRVAFIETESSFPIAVSNKASKFIPPEDLQRLGSAVLSYIKSEEET
jgi:hypothetical protein